MKKQTKKQTVNKPKIVFKEDTHQYFVNGVELPSVSQIMKPASDGLYNMIPDYILDDAKKRGKGVHQAIQDYWLFGVVSEEYQDYVERFIEFIEKWDLTIYKCEYMVTDGVYAGTLDLILKRPNGVLVLADIKTTFKIHKYLLELQLCGYNNALKHEGIEVEEFIVIQIKREKDRKTGEKKAKLKYEPITPNEEGWYHLVEIYKQKNKVDEHPEAS